MNEPLRNLPRPTGLLVVANILARTAEMAAVLNQPTEELAPKERLSPERQRLQDMSNLIESKFGCHSSQTRELVSMIIQAALPPPTVTGEDTGVGHHQFVPGALIVGENGNVVLITNTDRDGDAVYMTDGLEPGGFIDSLEEVRAPTAAEIDAFLKAAGLQE